MQGWFVIWKSINVIHYINKLKGKKKLMIISLEAEKNIWQNTTPLHVKSIIKIRKSRPIPKHNKSNLLQSNSQYQFKVRHIWSNPITIKGKTSLNTLPISIQYSIQSAREKNQTTKKKIKGIQIDKEETKLSLFANDMILYISDPKNNTREFSPADKQLQQSGQIKKLTQIKL
jgi:hypothetical protein